MVNDRPMWVDFGMAVAVAVFLAIVLFARSAGFFELLLLTYGVTIVVWAFIAESAAIRWEKAPAVGWANRQPKTKPLPH